MPQDKKLLRAISKSPKLQREYGIDPRGLRFDNKARPAAEIVEPRRRVQGRVQGRGRRLLRR